MDPAGVSLAAASVVVAAGPPLAQALQSHPLIILHTQQIEDWKESISRLIQELKQEEHYTRGVVSIRTVRVMINASLQILSDAPWPVPKDRLRALSVAADNTILELERLEQIVLLFMGPALVNLASKSTANKKFRNWSRRFQSVNGQQIHRTTDSVFDSDVIDITRQQDLMMSHSTKVSVWRKLQYYIWLQPWYTSTINHLMQSNTTLSRQLGYTKDVELKRKERHEVWSSVFQRVTAEWKSIEETSILSRSTKALFERLFNTPKLLLESWISGFLYYLVDEFLSWLLSDPPCRRFFLPSSERRRLSFSTDNEGKPSVVSENDVELRRFMHTARVLWILMALSISTEFAWTEDTVRFYRNVLPSPQRLSFEVVERLASETTIRGQTFPPGDTDSPTSPFARQLYLKGLTLR